jgi:hypothetical protein
MLEMHSVMPSTSANLLHNFSLPPSILVVPRGFIVRLEFDDAHARKLGRQLMQLLPHASLEIG